MRKTESNLSLLRMIFGVGLIISNVATAKLIYTGINLFGVTVSLPGAALYYAITFLMTDVISEIWGRDELIKYLKENPDSDSSEIARLFT